MSKELKAVCFGEVLWDVFPDKERIGGAPLNGASRLSSMGIQTEMISRIGADKKGVQILSYLKSNNVGTNNIRRDKKFPTGVVNVELSGSGSATYEIAYPAAWDKIEISEEMIEVVESADVFIFGSLICRDEISEKALLKLLPKASYKVLDFNLRPPHYNKKILTELIKHADFIKFNDDELFEMSSLLDSPFNSLEQNIHFMANKCTASSICITKGKHGAVLLRNGNLYYNSGFKIKVKDTVGAGDSFLATLIAKLLQKENPQQALDYACAVGALVAGKEGANPRLENQEIEQFISGSEI